MTTSHSDPRDDSRLLGSSPAFSAMLQQVSAAAPLNRPLLIVGERGTGKELVAARVHYLSERWQRSYHKLNCAAISDTLIESELFGHEAGAFTGATKKHIGRFERASGGSLFMDELATTSLRVQEQLLRVIEYGEFQRLGGSDALTTDVRLIAATNQDLPALAEAGNFRPDLLDRLSFDVITLPPLRERPEDIELLAHHFATSMSHDLQRDYFAGFSEHAIAQLLEYPWPGNVRELKNTVERSTYRNENWEATLDTIVFDPFESPWRPLQTNTARSANTQLAEPTPVNSVTPHEQPPSHKLPMDLRSWLQEQELPLIRQALQSEQYNQRKAAAALGLSYHQLRASLRKYPSLISSAS
ncbi:MAG: phage shock protein operon transcriptional activator [Pseudomonadales bacterium]